MSRPIKFRAWDGKEMHRWGIDITSIDTRGVTVLDETSYNTVKARHIEAPDLMQFTGLTDKNGQTEVYEGDIIDTEGNIIGNQYETSALLEDKSNLLIQGFGTKDWLTTYKEAVDRGCYDAQ